MVHVDVTYRVAQFNECGLVCSISLVSSVDGAGLPGCPVDVILKHSNTPDVVLTHNYRHTKPLLMNEQHIRKYVVTRVNMHL